MGGVAKVLVPKLLQQIVRACLWERFEKNQ
jgi:hypothetical protein